MKIAVFPFHQPFLHRMMGIGHKWTVVDGFKKINWDNQDNMTIGSNTRPLPDNAKKIAYGEFINSVEDYDLVLLQTAEHWKWFGKRLEKRTNVAYSWVNVFQMSQQLKRIVGDKPIAYGCGTFNTPREQDMYIREGFSADEFSPIGSYIEKAVFPVNRFRYIGRNNPHVVGYDWEGVLNRIPTDVMGFNPMYPNSTKLTFEEYAERIPLYKAGLQLSHIKQRGLTTSEMMLAGIPVIVREQVQLLPIPEMQTVIVNGENGFIVQSEDEMVATYNAITDHAREVIGDKARETILNEFPMDVYKQQWSEFFDKHT